jgi:hypothetical protein
MVASMPRNFRVTFIRFQQPQDHSHHGCLAGTVRTEKPVNFTGGNIKRNINSSTYLSPTSIKRFGEVLD